MVHVLDGRSLTRHFASLGIQLLVIFVAVQLVLLNLLLERYALHRGREILEVLPLLIDHPVVNVRAVDVFI